MKRTPRVPGNIPLMDILYKYISHKVLVFMATEGDRSTESGVTYLSHYPENYSNFSIHPVLFTHVIIRYPIDCNKIDNQNSIRKSDIDLDKYWVTQSGYFRLATTVGLGMGITDGKNLLFHGIL